MSSSPHSVSLMGIPADFDARSISFGHIRLSFVNFGDYRITLTLDGECYLIITNISCLAACFLAECVFPQLCGCFSVGLVALGNVVNSRRNGATTTTSKPNLFSSLKDCVSNTHVETIEVTSYSHFVFLAVVIRYDLVSKQWACWDSNLVFPLYGSIYSQTTLLATSCDTS